MRVFVAAFVVLVATPALAQKFKPQDPNATIRRQEKSTLESLQEKKAKQAPVVIKNPAYRKVKLSTLPEKNNKIDVVAFLAGTGKFSYSMVGDPDDKVLIRNLIADLKARKLQSAEKRWAKFLGSIKNQNIPINLSDLIAHVLVSALLPSETENLKIVRTHLTKLEQKVDVVSKKSRAKSALKSIGAKTESAHTFCGQALLGLHGAAAAALGNLK